ncbi:MAG: type III secretion system chaperone [Methylocystis sp.]|uniref:type III secretion system chaperone n=1 Tax=Methylocystis sp. TaxID=1911079 RepID=UPI003DA39E14
MRDIDEAMSELATAAGLADFGFHPNGRATLFFDSTIEVVFIRLDAETLELAVYLDLPAPRDADMLRALLHANHLGEATGPGRLALDTQDDAVVFCERLRVTELDAGHLESRLLEFVRHARFWLSDEGTKLVLGDGVGTGDVTLPRDVVLWA